MNLDDITGEQILALPMEMNDAGATTVKAYLKAIISRVWELGEGFGGKRPFGNSGWEGELYAPLVVAGFVEGHEEDGAHYIKYDGPSQALARELIFRAIEAL